MQLVDHDELFQLNVDHACRAGSRAGAAKAADHDGHAVFDPNKAVARSGRVLSILSPYFKAM